MRRILYRFKRHAIIYSLVVVALLVGAGAVYAVSNKGPTKQEIAAKKAKIAAQKKARIKAQWRANEAGCRKIIGPTLSAVETVHGQVQSPISYDEYSDAVRQMTITLDRENYNLSQAGNQCKMIIDNLNGAIDAYKDANGSWMDCMNDLYTDSCVGDSVAGVEVQLSWQTASMALDTVRMELRGLGNGVVPIAGDDSSSQI